MTALALLLVAMAHGAPAPGAGAVPRKAVKGNPDLRRVAARRPPPVRNPRVRDDDDERDVTIKAHFSKIINVDGSGGFETVTEVPHLNSIHGRFRNSQGDVRDRQVASITYRSHEVAVFEEPDENPFDHQSDVIWRKKGEHFRYEEEMDASSLPALILRSAMPRWRHMSIQQVMQNMARNRQMDVFQEPEEASLSVTVPGRVTKHNGDTLSKDKRTVTWDLTTRDLDDWFTLTIECGAETEEAKKYRKNDYRRLVEAAEEEPYIALPNPGRPTQPTRAARQKFIRQIGIRVSDLEEEDREGPTRRGGMIVDSIDRDGPAKACGLKVGDIIIRVNDRATRDYARLKKALKRVRKADETSLTLTIVRRGKEQELPKFKPDE